MLSRLENRFLNHQKERSGKERISLQLVEVTKDSGCVCAGGHCKLTGHPYVNGDKASFPSAQFSNQSTDWVQLYMTPGQALMCSVHHIQLYRTARHKPC